jgi:hypothetical protein
MSGTVLPSTGLHVMAKVQKLLCHERTVKVYNNDSSSTPACYSIEQQIT